MAKIDTLAAKFRISKQLLRPDIALVDLQLSGDNYAELIAKLLHTCPQTKLLAFSHHNSEQVHLKTFCSGAMGIISKHHSSDLLLKAIHAIHTGEMWFDDHVTKFLWQAQLDSNQPVEMQADEDLSQQAKLSNSERHIACLASKGLSAKEISAQLLVAEKTVRNQLSAVYRKIGVKKQIELCLKAPMYNYFKESHIPGTFYPKKNKN